jgi:uncharacterized membrane protein YccC
MSANMRAHSSQETDQITVTPVSIATMSPFFQPIDLSKSNRLFALRLVVSVTVAIAIAFWLQVQDPQWAGLTACLVIQPTAGAVLAKSVYRVIGTIVGAFFGLLALSIYAQAPIPFVGLMVLWLSLSVYGAARVRNFAAYGFLLAGYSALLIGFEGIASPMAAWTVAVDRTAEILLGVACSTAVTLTLAPVYAGDILRQSLRQTFSSLVAYAAKALDADTPVELFSTKRKQMIADVVKFDALCSYTNFESPERRAGQVALGHVVRDFLAVLALARSLYFRLAALRQEKLGAAFEHVAPVLAEAAVILQTVSTMTGSAFDPQSAHSKLRAVRQKLVQSRDTLTSLAGSVPFDELANAVLVINQANDMVRGLSMVVAAESAVSRRGAPVPRRGRGEPDLKPTEAVLQAARAGLALLLVIIFWNATGWSAGFSAVSGIAIVVFFLVNQDDPGKIAWPYIRGVAFGSIAAYMATAYVLPELEDFTSLAIFMAIVLFPAGLLVGTPRFAFFGVGFSAFFIVGTATGNQFNPDPGLYVNNTVALLLGLVAFLFASCAILPVSSQLLRRRAWLKSVAAMACAARDMRTDRTGAREVLSVLADLLLRIDLSKARDEELLRGCLGAASTCVEIGRIHRASGEPGVPPAVVDAIQSWLRAIAGMYENLQVSGAPAPLLAEGETVTEHLYDLLAATPAFPGSPQGHTAIWAAASARFVIDRFDSDRAFLLRNLAFDSAGSEP